MTTPYQQHLDGLTTLELVLEAVIFIVDHTESINPKKRALLDELVWRNKCIEYQD